MVVHLDDETAVPAEKPADERTAAPDDDRMRVLVDLDPEPLGHPRLEELVEGAPPTAAGIGLPSHHTTVSRSAQPGELIAAVLSPGSAPAQLISRWLAGHFELVASQQLLDELEQALAYPKLRRHSSQRRH